MVRYHNQVLKQTVADGATITLDFSQENTVCEDVALWVRCPGFGVGDSISVVITYNDKTINTIVFPSAVPGPEEIYNAPYRIWNKDGLFPLDSINISATATLTAAGATPRVIELRWLAKIGNPLS